MRPNRWPSGLRLVSKRALLRSEAVCRLSRAMLPCFSAVKATSSTGSGAAQGPGREAGDVGQGCGVGQGIVGRIGLLGPGAGGPGFGLEEPGAVPGDAVQLAVAVGQGRSNLIFIAAACRACYPFLPCPSANRRAMVKPQRNSPLAQLERVSGMN